ncbi:MAG TPA: ABC transporter substrate-binding protein [Kiloniellales bacterium]
MSQIRAIAVSVALIAMFGTSGPARAATASPSDVVSRLNDTVLSVMREAEPLGFQGRFDRLAPELLGAFNFQVMASISVGKYWSKLDESQRRRLVDVFGRTSIATFASRFDGYSGEKFQIVEETPGPRDSVLVHNKLVKADGDSVEINYLLRQYDGRWRVVDVFLDAKYSEMALKRSEYTSVIANQGFDSLIDSLEEKLTPLAGPP